MKQNWLAYLQLSLAMVFVGSSVVVGKILTATLPVFLATALSLLVALVILIPALLFTRGFPKFNKRDYLILLAQAFFGIFLFRAFLLFGLRFTSSGYAGIITSTTPAVIGVISYLFLKERIGRGKALGIGLTVSGILLMQAFAGLGGMELKYLLIGSLLIFGSVVSEALFSVFPKSLSQEISPIQIAATVTVFGFILALPFAVYEMQGFSLSGITTREWLALIYYGVFVTVVSFSLWFSGLKKVDASTAGVFTGFIPISSVALSYFLLGEKIGFSHLIGAALVILGILFISKKENFQTQQEVEQPS